MISLYLKVSENFVSHFLRQFLVCTYTICQGQILISLLTKSCRYLYSFCTSLLHSFIIWLNVSSLSSQSILQRGNAWLFITLMRFLSQSLVSRTFLIFPSYSFLSFNFCLFDDFRLQFSQLLVIFSSNVLILSWFCNSIPSVLSLFPLFKIRIAIFSIQNFLIYSGCKELEILILSIRILIICISLSSSSSFLENVIMSFMYIRWLISFSDFVNI